MYQQNKFHILKGSGGELKSFMNRLS